jgi:hypothetical protein
MAATDPLFSMSLPNRAPSRNNGKNCARNSAALPMKVWVQWASSGCPATAAAISAAAGASNSKQHAPSFVGEPDQEAEAEQYAEKAHRSDIVQKGIEVEG